MAGYLLIPPAVEAVEKIVTGIIAACKSSASQEDYRKFSEAITLVNEKMQENGADVKGLGEALAFFQERQDEINKRLAKEIKEQPDESTEQLREESIAHHGLDSSDFNLGISGSTNAGKSQFGNFVGDLKDNQKFETDYLPVHKDERTKAEKRRCNREGLRKLVLGDMEGSGVGKNHAHKMVRERCPAAFDRNVIVIDSAVMIEDAGLALFCWSRGIPFTMVMSKMSLRTQDASEEEIRARVRQHVKDELEARTIKWSDDMLLFMDCKGPEQDKFDNLKFLELISAECRAKCG